MGHIKQAGLTALALTVAFMFGAAAGVWNADEWKRQVSSLIQPNAMPEKVAEAEAPGASVATATSSGFKVSLGERWDSVKKKLGAYRSTLVGVNQTKWWIYDTYWIGFRDGKVIEIFTSHPSMSLGGVNIGSTRSAVEKKLRYEAAPQWDLFGAKFTFENKGQEKVLYKSGSQAIIAYYDTLDHKKLLGIRIVNPAELVYKRYFSYRYVYYQKPSIPTYTTDTAQVNKDAARGVYLLSNGERTKHKLGELAWSDKAATSAYKHSKDMSVYKYFSHSTHSGKSPFDLMAAENIRYTIAAENIAMGYTDSIEAVFGWMNSPGHRKSLLNPKFKKIGVGVYGTYYTQHFYAP
ncbi:CAP domain-containing protein [Aneurinibacillus uraniidurans]|uniref:CAP domain-containing protein n=1 Tax=Aneurinibacillus uraniidurans TaxID=2966586 RepID=UPI00234A1E93|nr:CAP domain-containing protein [Aneurinibacillus sp. B1]WCN37372.1 CAP domain-containing protein [Aneurinibacillus sp. B1]